MLDAVSHRSSWSPNIQKILGGGLLSTSQWSITELPSITSEDTFTQTARGASGRGSKAEGLMSKRQRYIWVLFSMFGVNCRNCSAAQQQCRFCSYSCRLTLQMSMSVRLSLTSDQTELSQQLFDGFWMWRNNILKS